MFHQDYSKIKRPNRRPVGGGKVFVSEKIKHYYNPVLNLSPKFWGNILIIVFFVLFFWFFLYSPVFKLKEIIIEGEKLSNFDEKTQQSILGKNIFSLKTEKLRSEIIENSSIVKDVAIYRGIPNALKIVILEKKPSLVWVSSEKSFLIDEEGFVVKDIAKDDFSELPIVYDKRNLSVKAKEQIVSLQFVNFVNNIFLNFYDQIKIIPNKFEVDETTFDLYLYTEAGFYVKFDTSRDYKKQLEDLGGIIKENRDKINEYVDVRINGWVYFK